MSTTIETYVSISLKEYSKLLDDSSLLNCLRNAGVDNWCGYEEAQEMYGNENEEE